MLRPPVVADGWIVGSVLTNQRNLSLSNFGIGSCLGLPENLSADGKITTLLGSKISGNDFMAGATEIVDVVGEVHSDINLTVRIGDLVDNFHGRRAQ